MYETLQFLHGQCPGFDDFEGWILARNGGAIEPARIAWVNDRIRWLANEGAPGIAAPVPADPVRDANDLAFWDENGYVVLRDAVSREAALSAERAVWDFIEATGGSGHLVRQQRRAHDHGAAGPSSGVRRQPPIAAHPRGLCTAPGHRRLGRHRRSRRLQSPRALELAAHQGAFCCVPGFHRRIASWLDGLPPGANPRDEILTRPAVAVAGRAGDMALWSASLPHGASPNRGHCLRIAQYIAMYRADSIDRRPWS